jgi:hypothetical protein
MRTKVTLVLLLLNVALFAWIVQARHRWRIEIEDADRDRHPLRELAVNLQGLTIATPGSPAIVLEKRGGKTWNMVSPLDWLANETAVSATIREIQNLEAKLTLPVAALAKNGQTLADYGLDQPELTLVLTPASTDSAAPPAPVAIKLGPKLKGDNRYLLSPDGSRVHVVDDAAVLRIVAGFTGSRDRRVLTIAPFEARALGLEKPGGAPDLIRRDDERWNFVTLGTGTRADKTATEAALNGLAALRLTGLIAPDKAPADTGVAPAEALRITIDGTNRHETLLLGKPVPDAKPADGKTPRYGKIEGRTPLLQFDFPDALHEMLSRPQEKLRDARLVYFDLAAVASVTLASPGQPDLVLQRLDSAAPADAAAEPAWQALVRGEGTAASRTLPADRALVANLLANLAVLKATRFVQDVPSDLDKTAYGLKLPERVITLAFAAPPKPAAAANAKPETAASTPKPITLSLALGTDGKTYGSVGGQTFVYELPPDTLGRFPVVARRYRERLVTALPEGAQITALSLAPNAGGEPLYTHTLTDKETWPQALAAEPSVRRREALQQMLIGDKDHPALLRAVRAASFVEDAYGPNIVVNGALSPWAWKLTYKVSLPGAAEPAARTLLLGARAGAEQQAGSPKEEADVIFILEPALKDALWALIYGDRDPGPPRPGEPPAPPAPPVSGNPETRPPP